jgi:hypothetical protein
MRLLRGFDAVLLPSLSDEQPRIAYEALSQAVPVIGSATGGIREVVESGVNERLSPPNDVDRWAESFIWAGQNRAELREMDLGGSGACATRPTRQCIGIDTGQACSWMARSSCTSLVLALRRGSDPEGWRGSHLFRFSCDHF